MAKRSNNAPKGKKTATKKKKKVAPGMELITMETPEGIEVPVPRKKVNAKKSWGWTIKE